MTFELMKSLQNDAYRILQNSFYLEKLSHAYLLEGFTGCGKDEMAMYMAMQLLCTNANKPCHECENCKKIASGNHINVVVIRPSTEKMFIVFVSIPIVELISLIRVEKQISELKISSPKFRMDKLIFDAISINSSIIK